MMLELSITNYQMRRPPMATNVRALSPMPSFMVIHASENEYVKKMITTANALQKENQVQIEKDPSGVQLTLTRNFQGALGTIYLRENRKIHFEIESPYVEEIEVKAFFSKKIEKKHHVACITGVVPFTFDLLTEVRIAGNRITFTYTVPLADGKTQQVQYLFEMADVRAFARDLYEWAERKTFKIVKAIDEDFAVVVDHAPAPAPPPEGQLYSVLIQPPSATVEFGQTLQLSCRPIDVKGSIVQDAQLQWGVDPPSLGSITPDGLFTPNTDQANVSIYVTATQGQQRTSGWAKVRIVPKNPYPTGPMPSDAASSSPVPGGPLGMVHHAPAQQAAPAPPPPAPAPAGQKVCDTCASPLYFNDQYQRWYCGKCSKWF